MIGNLGDEGVLAAGHRKAGARSPLVRYKTAHFHGGKNRLQFLLDTAQNQHPIPGLDTGRSDLIDTRSASALVRGHAFPRDHQERWIVDEVEKVVETADRIAGRPRCSLVCILRTMTLAVKSSGQATAQVFTGASSDITFPR